MTYRSYPGGPPTVTTGGWNFPQGWMMIDILALQEMYGADYTAHATDTVYRWNSTTGEMSLSDGGGAFVGQGAPNGGRGGSANRVFLTTWDGGGNDTYDMSNYAGGVSIDLRPGQWSITSTSQLAQLGDSRTANGNVYNSYLYHGDTRSLIENGIGGAGNDTLTGNVADNRLQGNGGNDTLAGGDGNDTLEGGTGSDAMDGGAGIDTVTYEHATSGVTVQLAGQIGTLPTSGEGSGDTFQNIENIVGSGFADSLYGTDENNVIVGGAGNDGLVGRGGNDTLYGGAGADVLFGSDGVDVFVGSVDELSGDDIEDLGAGEQIWITDATADFTVTQDRYALTIDPDGAGSRAAITMAYFPSASGLRAVTSYDPAFNWGVVTFTNVTASSDFDGSLVEAAGNEPGTYATGGNLLSNDTPGSGLNVTGIRTGPEFVGGPLQAVGASGTTSLIGHYGTLGLSSNGTWYYELNNEDPDTQALDSGETGVEIFTYQAAGAGGQTDLAELTVFISGRDDPMPTAGDDRLTGTSDNDTISGLGGRDYIAGLGGNDVLSGDAGFDTLAGGAGADRLDGGAGLDFAAYDDANWGDLLIRLDDSSLNTGAAMGDTYISIEGIIGGLGHDTIYGAALSETLLGGGGDDWLYGGAGTDSLVGGDGGDRLAGGAGADRLVGGGGAGVDYASYEDANWGDLVISLADPTLNAGAAAGDTYSSIEGIVGGRGNDAIFGDSIRNYLYGRSGNDTLDGGLGNDSLSGQVGADSFQFTTALGRTNVDTINDFVHGEDKIVLSRAIFAGIDASLDASEFGAAGPSTLIVYNQATGQLSYDAGGSAGGAAPVVFAKVTAGTVLDHTDFIMIA